MPAWHGPARRDGPVRPPCPPDIPEGPMTTTSNPLAAVSGWPVRTAAVGVTTAEAAVASTGPLGEALPLASVSKLLTAMAVLVAVAEETLGLDDPAGPDGSTVAHLLA